MPKITIDWSEDFAGIEAKLDEVLAIVTQEGTTMSQQSEAIDALLVRLSEDWEHLRDLVAQANARAEEAAANDAADAATIAALQEANAAALADANDTVARLNSIDLDAAFPPEEAAPAAPAPVEEPPVNPSP